MNRTANPEVEMADHVASLLGTALTEADAHRFLLDAAGLLGTESFAAYGPNLRFRWRLGERVVEIEPYYGSLTGELSLHVNSFNPEYPIYTDEYESFEWADAADYPYLWTVELGGTPFNDWEPGEAYIINWDMFEETTAKVLGGLPDNLALMPPQWRRPFALRWDMGESGLGIVSFTGSVEGLTVTVESTGDEDDMDKDDIEFLLEDRGRDEPGRAMTMDELRRHITALTTTGTSNQPSLQPRVEWEIVPMRIGLTIPQILSIVEQVLDGAAVKRVLRRLGGRPSIRELCPVLRGDGWLAERSHFTGIWSIEVVTKPKGKRLRFDDRHTADYARRIAQALEQRYGFPYGMRTDNDGFLMRLFQVGDHGVKVTMGFSSVEVEIDSSETLLRDSYGD